MIAGFRKSKTILGSSKWQSKKGKFKLTKSDLGKCFLEKIVKRVKTSTSSANSIRLGRKSKRKTGSLWRNTIASPRTIRNKLKTIRTVRTTKMLPKPNKKINSMTRKATSNGNLKTHQIAAAIRLPNLARRVKASRMKALKKKESRIYGIKRTTSPREKSSGKRE